MEEGERALGSTDDSKHTSSGGRGDTSRRKLEKNSEEKKKNKEKRKKSARKKKDDGKRDRRRTKSGGKKRDKSSRRRKSKKDSKKRKRASSSPSSSSSSSSTSDDSSGASGDDEEDDDDKRESKRPAVQLRGGSRDDDDDAAAKGNPHNAPREPAGPVPPKESTAVASGPSFPPGGPREEAASAQRAARDRRWLPPSVPVIGPSLPPQAGRSAAADAAADEDEDDDTPVTPMSASALPAAYAVKVAVGLKQELVEIAVTPHTAWEAAKQMACAATSEAGAGLDPAVRTHSLTHSHSHPPVHSRTLAHPRFCCSCVLYSPTPLLPYTLHPYPLHAFEYATPRRTACCSAGERGGRPRPWRSWA